MKRQRVLTMVSVFVVLSTLVGCSSSRSTAAGPGGPAEAVMFPLSAEQADKIIASAVAAEFPGKPVSRVEFPNKGYQVTIRFALDSHTIVATMIPAKGRKPDGEVAEGFVFEVNDSGTMVISGRRRASKLFKRINERARVAAQPLPLVGYAE